MTTTSLAKYSPTYQSYHQSLSVLCLCVTVPHQTVHAEYGPAYVNMAFCHPPVFRYGLQAKLSCYRRAVSQLLRTQVCVWLSYLLPSAHV